MATRIVEKGKKREGKEGRELVEGRKGETGLIGGRRVQISEKSRREKFSRDVRRRELEGGDSLWSSSRNAAVRIWGVENVGSEREAEVRREDASTTQINHFSSSVSHSTIKNSQ